MLPLLTALVLAAAPLQDTAHVVVVATSDLHGHVTDWDYVAPYPWLAANVVDSTTARRTDWIQPYRLLEVGGCRWPVIGYITTDPKRTLPADRTSGPGGRGLGLIVAGHTHRVMTMRGSGVPILETGQGGRMVGGRIW